MYHPKNATISTSAADFADKDKDKDRDKDRDGILFGSMTPPLAALNRARVKKLVLKDAYEFHARLRVFLDVFPTLTALTFDGLIKGPLRIDILLMSCPTLRSLSIEYVLSDLVVWGPPVRSMTSQQQQLLGGDALTEYLGQPFAPPPMPRGHGLQTLILRHAISNQTVLQTMLQALPSLLSLEIRFLRLSSSYSLNHSTGSGSTFFNRPAFYRSLSGSCPNLQHLHFSLFQRLLLVPDSLAVTEALPTLTGLSFPCHDLESFRQPIDATVGPDTPRLGLLEFYVNHLTSLELLAYRSQQEDSLISNLHAFLTEAFHLRHLVAPKVYYCSEFLEMKVLNPNSVGVGFVRATEVQQYHQQQTFVMSAAASSGSQWATSKTKTWGWACRNLETLHLGFKSKETSTSTTPITDSEKRAVAEQSRIMFGFIARNCPHIRDLYIRKEALNLSLEGGFCLLTQLTQLERLTIRSDTKGFRLVEKDVSWIGYGAVDDVAVAPTVVQERHWEIPTALEATVPAGDTSTITNAAGTSISTSMATIASITETGLGSGTVPGLVAGAGTAITKVSIAPATTPVITVTVHDVAPRNKSASTSNNNNNNNRNGSSPNSSPNSSTSTLKTTLNPNDTLGTNFNKGAKKRIQSFFRRLSSPTSTSSSSSSAPSIPQSPESLSQQRHQQEIVIVQKRPAAFYANMPSRVVTVFKSDEDWFSDTTLARSASGWTNMTIPSQTHILHTPTTATTRSSTESSSSSSHEAEKKATVPLFASKRQSAYRCWPHLRKLVWSVDPVNIFHDHQASKVFSNLRPDIDFKVQQYIEW
ncbi:hypothetical protein BGZ97_007967 [Linnemannia gamsii]|uniref:Uncharacterized protein n=1 Tax=Linnemannia gamsii TaxID=64522 RepID=A0A9P6UQX0_9FUNG|nr:hypothetical protein BGZ97_007967 [Linnemannia gamsii]